MGQGKMRHSDCADNDGKPIDEKGQGQGAARPKEAGDQQDAYEAGNERKIMRAVSRNWMYPGMEQPAAQGDKK